MKKYSGVTLVELMIAMAISFVVLLGVGSVYVTSKRSYTVQEEFARMHENANFAFQFLTQDIRQAGYAGCNPVINNILNTTAANVDLFDFSSAVYGWEADGSNPGQTVTDPAMTPSGTATDWDDYHAAPLALHSTLVGRVLPGTDVIVVKSARERTGLIPNSNTPPNATSIGFAGATGIQQGEIVMITDCEKADLFMNGSNESAAALTRDAGCAGNNPCNKNPASVFWSHNYIQNEVRILTSTSKAYFIGLGASGEPALFRTTYHKGTGAADAIAEELVEGVENMQILYGEDLTGDTTFSPTRYVPMSAVTNINNVVSVRISLLLRTQKQLNRPNDTKSYELAGVNGATATTINPTDDSRMRKVFTTTIVLRNKLVTGRTITF